MNDNAQNGKDGQNHEFEVEDNFWGKWQGRIIRAIVLHRAFTADKILEFSKLDKQAFEKAYSELLTRKFIEEKEDGRIFAIKQIYKQCMDFFVKQQVELGDWVQEWRRKRRIDPLLCDNVTHFFLVDKSLSEFSNSLIEHAKYDIFVTNPFVKRCFLSDALATMSEKGVSVYLLTRSVEPQQYKSELLVKGVKILYDDSIHAKLIVVDRRIAIASSMNFYAGSSAGASWEAGIATTEDGVVREIVRSIIKKNDTILSTKELE
jgi:predicted peroxiredoxin